MKGKICLVFGGREFNAPEVLNLYLDHMNPDWVMHGDARGADRLGGEWAKDRGKKVKAFPANWSKHGKAAGFIRNEQMIESMKRCRDAGWEVVAIGCPGGRGTAHMTKLVKEEGFKLTTLEM